MNMRIRHNDIEINETDPFLNCKLGRKEYALVLTDIVKNFNDGFVLAIDNEWGTGKNHIRENVEKIFRQ